MCSCVCSIFFFSLIILHINTIYVKMELFEINNCITEIYHNNNLHKNFNKDSSCDKDDLTVYSDPLINNLLYEFGDKITFIIKNSGFNSYIKIKVFINEYIIECEHNRFWKCTNCSTTNGNYKFNQENGRFDLIGDGQSHTASFNIYFQINSLSQLNFEGNNVSSDFYALKPKEAFINISTFEIDNEIALINFNSPNYFYIQNNTNNISVNYSNYYFKIYFTDNSFSGKYIGIDLSNSDIELKNGSSFKVNDFKGLRYKLSFEEKKRKGVNLFFQVKGYNSPDNTTLSKKKKKKTNYNFNISISNNHTVCLNEILPYYYLKDENNYYICLNLTKEVILPNISKIIQDIEVGKRYEIKGNDCTINIYPLYSLSLYSLKKINFTECEKKIKNHYNLNVSNIMLLEIRAQVPDSSGNITYYQAYNDREYLDLLICNSSNLNVSGSLEFHSFFSLSPIIPLETFVSTTDFIYSSDIESNFIEYDILASFYNLTKEELFNDLPLLIKKIKIGESYKIEGDDYNMKISPTNVTHLSSTTHVNFKKCENFLRYYYNISDSRIITFMQLEINNTNSKILVNKVEYQAYDDNRELLDLSLCFDKDIKIVHSIKSSSLFDSISATAFKELGIDIFNIKDSFFTDVCYSYHDSKNDLTLKDRIKEIFQNFSLCEEDCSYDEINLINLTITCDCRVKTNISLDNITEHLIKYDEKSNNFQIIKCYKLVFSLKGKSFNIGFWIFLILVTAHIPLLIIYFYKGFKPIRQYIYQEMVLNGYIKQKNFKDKNGENKKGEKKSKINGKNKKKEKRNNKINGQNKNKKNKKKKKKNKKNKNLEETSRKYLGDNNILLNLNENNNIKNIHIQTNKKSNNFNSKIKKSNKSKNMNKIPTGVNIKLTKHKNLNKLLTKKQRSNSKLYNLNIINVNLNDKDKTYEPKESKQILNNYSFEQAIKHDYRSICLIYYIILLSKQAIFHAFLFKSPLEPFSLRLCLLIFIYSSDLALNALFYLDDKISEKYKYAQNFFLFAFSNNITVILLSTLAGFLFMTLFINLSNSTNEMRNVFREEEIKLTKNKKYKVSEKRKKEIVSEIEKILKRFKIKLIILIIIEFSLMLFFWYYVTAFCHVYNNTQYSWLFDSFLSILSRTVIDFLFPMGLAKLYRMAIESNVYCLYKIAIFLYSFA